METWNEFLARLRRRGRSFRGWCREVKRDAERTRYVLQRANVEANPDAREEFDAIFDDLARLEGEAA